MSTLLSVLRLSVAAQGSLLRLAKGEDLAIREHARGAPFGRLLAVVGLGRPSLDFTDA
jgi:hypothetical protein